MNVKSLECLPDRISDEMLECTDILSMMKRKGSAVFVNDLSTWTGLQIPPVELNWMDELFEGYRSRQKARNVRVELLANISEVLHTSASSQGML